VYTIDLFSAASSVALIGNKAASLAELHRAAFLVPKGICVTTVAHLEWVGAGGMTTSMRAQLFEAFRQLKMPVAVRSSSPAEDLPDASYAGHYATVLGVSTEEELLQAVECWRPAASEASNAYRKAQGYTAAVDMAVLIQELVNADVAGVMFAMNPVTNQTNQIVMNASSAS
jgi:pyruvate,water dikinase